MIDFGLPDKMLLAQLKQENDIVGRLLACGVLAKRDTHAWIEALKGASPPMPTTVCAAPQQRPWQRSAPAKPLKRLWPR